MINKNCKCGFCQKPDWMTTEEFITEASKFLGYPKCCTKAYLDNVSKGKDTFGLLRHLAMHEIENVYNKSDLGFVPCLYHADRIVNQKKNVKRMFRNRICITSFPYASKSEFKNYLKKLKKEKYGRTTRNNNG